MTDFHISHLNAVKRIFNCIKGTIHTELQYPKTISFNILGYSDADFTDCLKVRKSTSGTCYFLGNCLMSWQKAELCCPLYGVSWALKLFSPDLWMKQALDDFQLKFIIIFPYVVTI